MIRSNKGHLVQERLFPSIPKVFKPQRSKLCHERSPRRDLREPLRVTVPGTQTNSSWILLAHYAEGCPDSCQNLRQISKVQQHHQVADGRTNPNDSPVAICSMGTGHHGPILNSNAAAEVPYNRHILFHQMDGSRSLGHHH